MCRKCSESIVQIVCRKNKQTGTKKSKMNNVGYHSKYGIDVSVKKQLKKLKVSKLSCWLRKKQCKTVLLTAKKQTNLTNPKLLRHIKFKYKTCTEIIFLAFMPQGLGWIKLKCPKNFSRPIYQK